MNRTAVAIEENTQVLVSVSYVMLRTLRTEEVSSMSGRVADPGLL